MPLQPGQMLQMERAGASLIVGDRIGEGGQGVVHRARLNGVPFAVKWYRGGPGTEAARKAINALMNGAGPRIPPFVADRPGRIRAAAGLRVRDAAARCALYLARAPA